MLKPFTNYICSSGEIGGHSGHYTGAYKDPRPHDEFCTCGLPMMEEGPKDTHKVTFETVSPHVAASMEARRGRQVWQMMSNEQWDTLEWYPVTSENKGEHVLRDQYHRLLLHSQSHEQPIRNVKMFQREASNWMEFQ